MNLFRGRVLQQSGILSPAEGGTGAGALTAASVPYIGAGGVFAQDNSQFNYVSGLLTATNLNGATAVQSAGTQIGYNKSAYASGTAYTLTGTAAAIAFGTTSPAITLDKGGTWLLFGRANIKYVGATYAANQTATVNFQRTNNTPAAIANGTSTITLSITTTLTGPAGIIDVPMVIYTTANTNDALTLYGIVSATPAAGSMQVIESSIVAVRLQ